MPWGQGDERFAPHESGRCIAVKFFDPAFAAGQSSLKDDTAIPPGCPVARTMIEKNEPNGGVSGRLKL